MPLIEFVQIQAKYRSKPRRLIYSNLLSFKKIWTYGEGLWLSPLKEKIEREMTGSYTFSSDSHTYLNLIKSSSDFTLCNIKTQSIFKFKEPLDPRRNATDSLDKNFHCIVYFSTWTLLDFFIHFRSRKGKILSRKFIFFSRKHGYTSLSQSALGAHYKIASQASKWAMKINKIQSPVHVGTSLSSELMSTVLL